MLLSQGSVSIFWSNPLVGSITALALLLLVWPVLGAMKHAARRREYRAGTAAVPPSEAP